MKHILKLCCGIIALLSTAACNNDEWEQTTGLLPSTNHDNKVCITAYAAGNSTNTRVEYSAEGNTFSLDWEDEESFSVMRGGENNTFAKTTEGNNFAGIMPTAGTGNFYAFYPVTEDTTPTAVTLDLTTQTGTLNSNCTYMRASSIDGELFEFKHCTAILKAAFSGLPADATISKVMITFTKAFGNPTINLTNGTLTDGTSKTITITHATPVATDALHYIYLPPMAQADAVLKITVDTSVGEYSGTLSATKNIEAGKIYTATVAMTLPYVTFSVVDPNAEQTFTMETYGGYALGNKFQYSVGNNEWATLEAADYITFGGTHGNLRLRGKSSEGTAANINQYCKITFINSTLVACTGDIRTLVDWEKHVTTATNNAQFHRLFYGCSALQTAPALPAEDLKESCYSEMFNNCKALTTAPELPATNLKDYCYQYMFNSCTALTAAPKLPATNLANYCYRAMFRGCYFLTTAPELPATNLKEGCYNEMFYGCSALQTAPLLQAPVLIKSCYEKMFNSCYSLSSITMLATDINAQDCLYEWVSNVAATGTFTKAAEMESLPEGNNGIPSGWSIVEL